MLSPYRGRGCGGGGGGGVVVSLSVRFVLFACLFVFLIPLDCCVLGTARLSKPKRHDGLSVVSLQAISAFQGCIAEPVRAGVPRRER